MHQEAEAAAGVIFTHPQFILLQVKENNHEPWLLTIVYGNMTHGLRKHLWSTLSRSNLNLEGPWLVTGDFNAVTSTNEVGDSKKFSQARCASFMGWIFEEGLLDLGFLGTRFTWRR